jgi:hypothetical protein
LQTTAAPLGTLLVDDETGRHRVIGAGVVGLAIARTALAGREVVRSRRTATSGKRRRAIPK